ncbi:4-hydroxythreonine-4-phosphate dehydrogenase PdxA [bacterium]|nr:4-hydroxythreonine-4-phosphate dehydrogenase PdxA [bacterium]
MKKPVIGITVGDPSGIGPEVVVRALADRNMRTRLVPVVFGDRMVLEQAIELTGTDLSPAPIENERITEEPADTLIPYRSTGIITEPALPGVVDPDNGRASLAAITACVDAARSGMLDGIVTAPVSKEALRRCGSTLLDQTSLIAELCAVSEEDLLTVFVTGGLRIFFLTGHVPLGGVPALITRESLLRTIRRCERCLRRFGIGKPALAVAALNPHGGEEGLCGREEIDVIRPAIEEAQREILDVRGPVSADIVFHQAYEGRFDGVLALYHDQGHIAAKTLDFHRTIVMTLGLPFVRTAPGHGTAFDIAGKGIANAQSITEAALAAAEYCRTLRGDLNSKGDTA